MFLSAALDDVKRQLPLHLRFAASVLVRRSKKNRSGPKVARHEKRERKREHAANINPTLGKNAGRAGRRLEVLVVRRHGHALVATGRFQHVGEQADPHLEVVTSNRQLEVEAFQYKPPLTKAAVDGS